MDLTLVATLRGDKQPSSICVSVASGRAQLDKAAELVRKRYAWRGYCTSDFDEGEACVDSRALTLLAEAGDVAIGTMSVTLDNPRGLAVDVGYPEPLAAARLEGKRVCELTRLALAERVDTKAVLSALFALAYNVARAVQDVTDVFIEVNPRHVGFYERILGFVVSAGERICERVQAPAILLRAPVEELEARLCAYAAGSPTLFPKTPMDASPAY